VKRRRPSGHKIRKFWTAQAPVITSVDLVQTEEHALAYVVAALVAPVAMLWGIEANLSVRIPHFLSYDIEKN
jgi:hypothetical protein